VQAEGLSQQETPMTLLGIEADMTLFSVFPTLHQIPEEQNPLPKSIFIKVIHLQTYTHTGLNKHSHLLACYSDK